MLQEVHPHEHLDRAARRHRLRGGLDDLLLGLVDRLRPVHGDVRDPHLPRPHPPRSWSSAWPAWAPWAAPCSTSSWGNSVLWMDLHGGLGLLDLVRAGDAATAIAAALGALAGQPGPLLLFLILGFVFVATTYDSASYAIAAAATRNLRPGTHPHRAHRLFWAAGLALSAGRPDPDRQPAGGPVGDTGGVAADPRHRGPGRRVPGALAAGRRGRRNDGRGGGLPTARHRVSSAAGSSPASTSGRWSACGMRTCAAAGARAASTPRRRRRWPASSTWARPARSPRSTRWSPIRRSTRCGYAGRTTRASRTWRP